MKKYILLTISALALISCIQENSPIQRPENNQKISITANIGDATKTTIDGYKVKWEANDTLAVIVKNNTTYGTCTPFVKNGSNNIFTGTPNGVGEGQNTYHVLYPYDKEIITCAPEKDGAKNVLKRNGNKQYFLTLGTETQVQKGSNTTDHLKFPLWGKATIDAGKDVLVDMEHLTTIFRIKVTNPSEKDTLNVHSIIIDNNDNEKLSGGFMVVSDTEKGKYALKSSSSQGVSFVKLNVKEAPILPKGNATFNVLLPRIYFRAVKTDKGTTTTSAANARTLTITINSSNSSKTIDINIPNEGKTYKPGYIYTKNITFEGNDIIELPRLETTDDKTIDFSKLTNIPDYISPEGNVIITDGALSLPTLTGCTMRITKPISKISLSSDGNSKLYVYGFNETRGKFVMLKEFKKGDKLHEIPEDKLKNYTLFRFASGKASTPLGINKITLTAKATL